MENAELIRLINKELAVDLPGGISYDELHGLLATFVNELIKNDFEKLVAYLYRIDVSELKLKSVLQQNSGEDAGSIIAALIIERQGQKIKTRQQFNQRDNNISEEDKW